MLDRTDHARLAEQTNRRLAAAVVADRYIERPIIPAAGRDVERTDNLPPEIAPVADEAAVTGYATALMAKTPAINSAKDASPLLKAFIADNPVIQTTEEAQQAATWIESGRKTLGAMEDERKPRVAPLNAAIKAINDPYRLVREPLEAMIGVLVKRWNKFDTDERARREAIAAETRRIAEQAAAEAQALIDQANNAIAEADTGVCDVDVGGAIVEAKGAMHDANVLDRAARRDEKNIHVRVASELGGRALSSRRKRVIVIDDPCAAILAIKANGSIERIIEAIQFSAKAFEEAFGELPPGTHETYERSI